MSPAAAFHTQLASIMEVLANTAVAEICELVDSGYSVLQLEISRSRKENEQLRRKLRLMELRAARSSALRALCSGGPARAPVPGHHGDQPRRSRAPRGEAEAEAEAASAGVQEGGASGPPEGPGHGDAAVKATPTTSAEAVTPPIKTEDGGESWSRSERDEDFCHVIDEETRETEAPPTSIKQEVAEECEGSTPADWMGDDVTSSCWSDQQPLSTDPIATHNPLRGEPGGHSFTLGGGVGVSPDSGGGGFSLKEPEQQGAGPPPPPPPPQQLPARKPDRLNAFIRKERRRFQDGGGGGPGVGGARAFVCNCCGKTLASLKNLNTHMRVHTGEKPFVCALCGKRFSDPSNLKRHQRIHTGEKRYGCVHCGKRFAQSGSLKVHMSVHTDCKQLSCSSCGKTFISSSHLRRHAAMHAAAPFSDH